MANEMIKFYKGLEASLPASGVNGALYITTDEGAIYLGTGTGMKRLGDFVQVANVASLPAKAHENCLYYCVAENILAKWNGAEWKQVNKQPTTAELKTLLGLGSMAYKSEVAEADLTAELAEKVNAAAEGNHSHANKTVLDGITAEKVAAWDSAEANANAHADGLNTAMNTRVEALEAVDHEHANKALLDTYTQTEADLADAVEKKHEHANATELAKIADGDKAKWDAVVADHLTSADKTTLETSIKEAKKAGTDANTNIEAYKVTNDSAIAGIQEDIAEITDGSNGILAQAKTYADGKDSAIAEAKAAGTNAQANLEAYQTSNNNALAGVKATAEAAATKVYADEELAKKVDKVTGKSLVDDAEITKLAGVSTGANKVEASETNGNIKIDGVETVVYTHPAKHTVSEISDFDDSVKAYDYATKAEAQAMADGKNDAIAEAKKAGTDAQAYAEGVAGDLSAHVSEAEGKYETKTDADNKLTEAKGYTDTEVAKVQGEVDALETYVGTIPTDEKYADITNVISYVNKKAEETLTAAQGGSSETAASVKQQLDNYKSENDTRVKAAEDAIDTIEADYLKAADKTEVVGLVTAETTRATGIEAGLRTDVDAIKGDYLKAADKTVLQDQITANANAIELLTNGASAEEVDGVNDLINYVKEHGTEVTGMQESIADNAEAIAAINNADTGILKQAKDYADGLAGNYATADHDHVVADITDFDEKVKAYGYATTGEVAAIKSDLEAKDAELAAAIETAKTDASNKDAVVLSEAQKYADTAKAEAIADAEGKIGALSDNVYTKEQTYTQEEVDDAIEAAVTEACSWGEF